MMQVDASRRYEAIYLWILTAILYFIKFLNFNNHRLREVVNKSNENRKFKLEHMIISIVRIDNVILLLLSQSASILFFAI